MRDEQRFEAIQRRYAVASEREERFRYGVLLRRYGRVSPPTAWMTRTETAKLEACQRAQDKAMDAMFELLDRISPRRWRSGIAAWWVMEKLVYADAVTRGRLSAVPQPGYGSTPRDAEVFAGACTP